MIKLYPKLNLKGTKVKRRLTLTVDFDTLQGAHAQPGDELYLDYRGQNSLVNGTIVEVSEVELPTAKTLIGGLLMKEESAYLEYLKASGYGEGRTKDMSRVPKRIKVLKEALALMDK